MQHKEIPWREIKLMRNIVAHRYDTVDHSITWDVVEKDIPTLKPLFIPGELNSMSKKQSNKG